MLRLKTRPQFQAAMNGGTIARTAHFALHRLLLADIGAAHTNSHTSSAIGHSNRQPVSDVLQSTHTDSVATSKSAHPLFAVNAVWLGAMVPKRWARRAVTRNTIKRQIYAVSAAVEDSFCVAAHVVRLRSTFDRKQYLSATSDQLKQDVRSELQQLFAAVQSSSRMVAQQKDHV